jgi:hypothetical protein
LDDLFSSDRPCVSDSKRDGQRITVGDRVLAQSEIAVFKGGIAQAVPIGSIMVMFVAQAIFFFGVRVSNMTTMALTMLAFPFISLILELVVGRVKLSSLGIYDLAGFALVAAGYVIFVSKRLCDFPELTVQ